MPARFPNEPFQGRRKEWGKNVPVDDPSVTDEMWVEGARTHFDGKIIVGKDLMEV
jgi:hypothetical protein